jgi:two-component system cell cycle sensor histidine kinase/response regulator CckA
MELLAKPTILVVDDEMEVLRLVEAVLTRDGFNVVLAKGADIAIAAFGKMAQKPALVLSDVVMPGMSGPMLVDRLVAIQPGTPVLFMSGYDERHVVQRYVVERGFALIPKPFTAAQLTAAVHAVVEGQAPATVTGAGQ